MDQSLYEFPLFSISPNFSEGAIPQPVSHIHSVSNVCTGWLTSPFSYSKLVFTKLELRVLQPWFSPPCPSTQWPVCSMPNINGYPHCTHQLAAYLL